MSRRLRVALGGISHETNTFALRSTDLVAFEQVDLSRGAQILARHATAHTSVAGFLAAGTDLDLELIPLVYAWATPAGPITAATYTTLLSELLQGIRDGGPWDAVLLAQHGAAVAEGEPDVDGDVVSRVRELVGPGVPIGVALDLHANISPRLVAASTIIIAYRTNPHLDAVERARECATIVAAAARGTAHPVQALVQLPAAIEILRHATGEEPMRSAMQELELTMTRPGVLSASLTEGYPYADVAQMGMAVVVVHDGDADAARREATDLAGRVWASREGFVGQAPTADEALRDADDQDAGPVVLMDVGDNIGGGGPADGTVLLEAARRLGIRGFLAIIDDPAAVAAAVAVGVGGTVSLSLGGHRDPRNGTPVSVTGHLRAITDGRYEEAGVTHGGFRFFDAGPSVVLTTDLDHVLLITSRPVMPTSLEQLRSAGIDVGSLRVIAAKGVVSPRAAYDRVAVRTILVDTPGVTAGKLARFEYQHRRRPMLPFETDATFGGSLRMHDLLIRGATVVDGTGRPGLRADVAVADGRIVAVGRDAGPRSARRVVDADGLTIAPGFIDIHSHADFTLPAFPGARNSLSQGVTSEVVGNCSWSPAPLSVDPGLARQMHDISVGIGPHLDWDWTSMASFMARLDAARPAVNCLPLVGHAALRVAAMGMDTGLPTGPQMAAMAEALRVSLAAGAWGVSTGLVYPPSAFAATEEIHDLAREAAAVGALYASHVRDEADHALEAVEEAIATAVATGVRVQISHLKSAGQRNRGVVRGSLESIARPPFSFFFSPFLFPLTLPSLLIFLFPHLPSLLLPLSSPFFSFPLSFLPHFPSSPLSPSSLSPHHPYPLSLSPLPPPPLPPRLPSSLPLLSPPPPPRPPLPPPPPPRVRSGTSSTATCIHMRP